MSVNDNGRRDARVFPTMGEAFEALALDGAMLFLLRKFRGQGWRLEIRRSARASL